MKLHEAFERNKIECTKVMKSWTHREHSSDMFYKAPFHLRHTQRNTCSTQKIKTHRDYTVQTGIFDYFLRGWEVLRCTEMNKFLFI
jgi:hypothetical protein